MPFRVQSHTPKWEIAAVAALPRDDTTELFSREPGWQAFLRQYQDFMQIILVGAAVINQVFTGEWGTTLVLLGLTVLNAVMGLNQESKAEASLAALQQMMKNIARVA